MKKSELISIIREYLNDDMRKMIKDEVQHALLDIFDIDSKPVMNTESVNHASSVPQKKKLDIKFNSKGVLSDVMNETIEHYEPISDDDSLPSFMNQAELNQNTSKPTELNMSTQDVSPSPNFDLREQIAKKMGINLNSTGINQRRPVTVDEMVPDDKKHVPISEELGEILTRDYSSLIKKLDSKKKK